MNKEKQAVLQCPRCGSDNSNKHGKQIYSDGWWKRRRCMECGHIYKTERVDDGA